MKNPSSSKPLYRPPNFGYGHGSQNPKLPKRKPPVTIVIAIKCENGIVMAADSRTSDPSGYIRDDAVKIHKIAFQDGNTALVGEAGSSILGSIAVDYMEVFAKNRPLHDWQSVVNCAQEAVVHVKQMLKAQFFGPEADFPKHFSDYSFELMLAHYHAGKPYIFTLDSGIGIAQKTDAQFSAIGCGWQLADFLISRIGMTEFSTVHALWAAIYAVEEIKKCDYRCGGKTRCGIMEVGEDGISSQVCASDDPVINQLVENALAFSGESKTSWQSTVDARIQSLANDPEK